MASRPRSPTEHPDTTPISLNRILSRLEQQVLSADSNQRLRTDSFERRKTANNIEYARTLLLKLEHDISTPAAPSRAHSHSHYTPAQKSALQQDLQQKRHLIKQLNQRIYELDQLDDESDNNSAESSGDEEWDKDLYPSYAPRVREESGLESGGHGSGNEALQAAARGIESSLRARRTGAGQEQKDNSGITTGTSLFDGRGNRADSKLETSEALLSHNRSEQEDLTNSLLSMAQQLKSQSIQFGQTLESEKGILNRAVEGLDRNAQGLDAASQRMGVLRRMTEGRGWWDRMKLYAIIFGLWIIALVIVFVLPKLRF